MLIIAELCSQLRLCSRLLQICLYMPGSCNDVNRAPDEPTPEAIPTRIDHQGCRTEYLSVHHKVVLKPGRAGFG